MGGELASLSLSEVWFALVAGWQCQPPSSRSSQCTSAVERTSLMTWLYWQPLGAGGLFTPPVVMETTC